jgi:hypothetical protein
MRSHKTTAKSERDREYRESVRRDADAYMQLIKTRYAVTVICRICGKDELTDKPWGWIAEHLREHDDGLRVTIALDN